MDARGCRVGGLSGLGVYRVLAFGSWGSGMGILGVTGSNGWLGWG